jgi:hypothetical protein
MAISKEVLGDEFLSNVVGSVGTMPSLQMLPDSSRRKRKTVSSASSNQGAGLSLGPDVGINSIDNQNGPTVAPKNDSPKGSQKE